MAAPSALTLREGDVAAAGGSGQMLQDAANFADVSTEDFYEFRRALQKQQERYVPVPSRAVLKRIPEVADDYIRNFLLRNGMHKTLDCFEVEWYERFGSDANQNTPFVPDNYLENASLLNRIETLEQDLRQHAELTTRATRQWAQAKRDRDFHRANHHRIVQEKNKLALMLKQAQAHAESLTPALTELKQRCDALVKTKSLLTIERDRLEQRVATLEKRLTEVASSCHNNDNNATNGHGESAMRTAAAAIAERNGSSGVFAAKSVTAHNHATKAATSAALCDRGADAYKATSGSRRKPAMRGTGDGAVSASNAFAWPPDERPRNSAGAWEQQVLSGDPTVWSNQTTFVAHSMPIAHLALHPRKPAVASCSDDGTWRLSALPQGDVIVSGQGHKNWVSCIAMHPHGTMLATGSGDKTVKLWDFASNRCSATLTAHTDGVWSVDFQETGTLLASGSLDYTARVWDVEQAKCRQTLRGHVDVVNSVAWQQYTNVLCTGSGDKTVSLWDCRLNYCAQTFYGHRNAVMGVATSPAGDTIISCDADGVVVVWDTRRMEERCRVPCSTGTANHVAIDATGSFIAVACDDGIIRIISTKTQATTELRGHTDAVQCAVFDPATNGFLVSCGRDCTVRCWS